MIGGAAAHAAFGADSGRRLTPNRTSLLAGQLKRYFNADFRGYVTAQTIVLNRPDGSSEY